MNRRITILLAVVGVILFLLALWPAAGLWRAIAQARATDRGDISGEGGPLIGCNGLQVAIDLERRVMSVNESQALTVHLTNQGETNCAFLVTLLAPDFTLSPFETSQQVSLEPAATTDVNWVLAPRAVGDYALVVNVAGQAEVLGLSVRTILGLTALQAQLLSALGGFLGPMLTLPWWYQQWRERQKEKQQAAATAALAAAAAAKKETTRSTPFE